MEEGSRQARQTDVRTGQNDNSLEKLLNCWSESGERDNKQRIYKCSLFLKFLFELRNINEKHKCAVLVIDVFIAYQDNTLSNQSH